MINIYLPLLPFVFVLFICSSLEAQVTYDVVSLGAIPDGKTDSTDMFLRAWALACASSTSAIITVPPGQYFLRNALFVGQNCNNSDTQILINGTIIAPADYNVNGGSDYWIKFEKVTGVSISGGILDGQGTPLWACKASKKKCPKGVVTLTLSNSKNVVVNGLTSLNSQMVHIVVDTCQDIKLLGTKISASGKSPNTDGVHVQESTGVTIFNSEIATGDDCVSLGPGSKSIWIENISCGPGHGISIGSLGWNLGEDGVQNVTVKTVTFKGTSNGVRIKAWARPTNGFVNNVVFQDLVMVNVEHPILIDQQYCPNKKDCPGQVSGVKINNVTYQDINGTSTTKVAVKFNCNEQNPCSGIRLENVNLTYKNKPAMGSCVNAAGTTTGAQQLTGCNL